MRAKQQQIAILDDLCGADINPEVLAQMIVELKQKETSSAVERAATATSGAEDDKILPKVEL